MQHKVEVVRKKFGSIINLNNLKKQWHLAISRLIFCYKDLTFKSSIPKNLIKFNERFIEETFIEETFIEETLEV